jgi:hypothetical protein
MFKVVVCVISGLLLLSLLASSATTFPRFQEDWFISIDDQFTPIIDPTIARVVEMINKSLLRKYLKDIVAFGPRVTGTYACEKAAEYIYHQFEETGLSVRYHNWSAFKEGRDRGFYVSQNVEGTLKGHDSLSDRVIIFSAHYDTVEGSPGANDDGSGTAAVLAAAYVLSQFEFKHTIRFVAFSGEEIGRLGSHEYVKELYERRENIVVDVNADVIGYARSAEGGRTMWITATEDAVWMFNVTEKLNIDYNIDFQIYYDEINREGWGWSDYFSFVEYGYEAVACWGGEWDPNEHTPADDLDNINFSYLVNTTRVITAMLAYIANLPDFYPQISIESPRFGKLYFRGLEKINISDLEIVVVDDIWIWADERVATVPIQRAEFYYDERLMYTDTEPPFKWHLNKRSIRKHRVTVVAYDKIGRASMDWRDIYIINLF